MKIDPETQQDAAELLAQIRDMLDTALVTDGHKRRFFQLTLLVVVENLLCQECGQTTQQNSMDFGAILHMNEFESVRKALMEKYSRKDNITSNCVGSCNPREQYHDLITTILREPDHFIILLSRVRQDSDHLEMERIQVPILIITKIFIKCNNVANIIRIASN